jgi:hypothetical protein
LAKWLTRAKIENPQISDVPENASEQNGPPGPKSKFLKFRENASEQNGPTGPKPQILRFLTILRHAFHQNGPSGPKSKLSFFSGSSENGF